MLAAAGVVFNDHGRVLLVHENYGLHRWGLPGGAVEAGETSVEATARELREETGLDAEVRELVGTYTTVGADRDAVVVRVYRCRPIGALTSVQHPEEIDEIGWFDPSDLPEPLTTTTAPAIADVLAGRAAVTRVLRRR